MFYEPPASRSKTWLLRLKRLRVRTQKLVPFVSGVLAAFVALLLYSAFVPPPHQITQREVNDTVAQMMASATAPPPYSEGVYEIIRPSLILIQVEIPGADGKVDEGLGSGVIVDDSGDILTSLHVVADASTIKVTFYDGTQSSAQIIQKQPANDIAALRAARLPTKLYPATLGNPNAINIGDEAYVVGNPFGLYGSMSAGIVSGLNRTFTVPKSNLKLQRLIQVDAAINPGNSGGPLLNRNGEVIGIVAGLLNPSDQNFFVGIGFAVPIDVAGGAVGSPPY